LHIPGEVIDEVFDRPFDRLLQIGILRLASEAEAPTPASAPEPKATTPAPAPEPEPEEPVDRELDKMTHKELVAAAEILGLEFKKNWSKTKLIELIEAA
jgi:hypothetical protein